MGMFDRALLHFQLTWKMIGGQSAIQQSGAGKSLGPITNAENCSAQSTDESQTMNKYSPHPSTSKPDGFHTLVPVNAQKVFSKEFGVPANRETGHSHEQLLLSVAGRRPQVVELEDLLVEELVLHLERGHGVVEGLHLPALQVGLRPHVDKLLELELVRVEADPVRGQLRARGGLRAVVTSGVTYDVTSLGVEGGGAGDAGLDDGVVELHLVDLVCEAHHGVVFGLKGGEINSF